MKTNCTSPIRIRLLTILFCGAFAMSDDSSAVAQSANHNGSKSSRSGFIKLVRSSMQELDSLSQPGESDLNSDRDMPADQQDTSRDDTRQQDSEQSIAEISFADPFGKKDREGRVHDEIESDVMTSGMTWGQGTISFPTAKFVSQVPSGLYHQRLFFEEPMLERYGVSPPHRRAELRSATRFLTRSVVMPFTFSGRRAIRGK